MITCTYIVKKKHLKMKKKKDLGLLKKVRKQVKPY